MHPVVDEKTERIFHELGKWIGSATAKQIEKEGHGNLNIVPSFKHLLIYLKCCELTEYLRPFVDSLFHSPTDLNSLQHRYATDHKHYLDLSIRLKPEIGRNAIDFMRLYRIRPLPEHFFECFELLWLRLPKLDRRWLLTACEYLISHPESHAVLEGHFREWLRLRAQSSITNTSFDLSTARQSGIEWLMSSLVRF